MFSIRQPNYPAGVQEAGHYLELSRISLQSPSVATAYAMLGLRRTIAGLHQDSNSAEGYRMLGLAHLLIDRLEAAVMQESGIQWFSANHNFQAIAAYQQAAHLKPTDVGIQSELLNLHEQTRRIELALDDVRQIFRLRPPPASPEQRKPWERMINKQFEWDGAVVQIENAVNQQLENGADRYQVAAAAYQAGAVRTAIKVLEDEAIYIEQNPVAKNALGAWLIEVGRIQDGLDTLEAVEQAASVGGGAVPGWRDSVANGFLVNGDYKRSLRLWNDELREEMTNSTNAALMTLPFQAMNPLSDQYPLTHTAAVSEVMGRARGTSTSLMFRVAMADLEMNQNEQSAASLKKILESDPKTPMRPLLKFYLEMLTDQKIEAKPPANPDVEEFEPLTEKSK
jgi:tetratricopeptide (TPR) repeat protein